MESKFLNKLLFLLRFFFNYTKGFQSLLGTNNLNETLCFQLCQRSRAFLFLNEIKRRFLTIISNDFSSTLAEQMYRYNEDCSTIIITKGEIDELNTIGVDSSGAYVYFKFKYLILC